MNPESLSQTNLPQEKQEQADKKLETGERVFNFLNKTGFLDVRKSDEKFEEWLQNLFYEDYKDNLTRLNGILRETPIKNRIVDGSGVEVSFGIMGDTAYLPPTAEQKDGLMRESFEALKQIPKNEDRALLAYYSLQAIHPYSDGNGRTGRLVYELISEDGKGITEEKLSELLDHDKEGHSGAGKGRDIFAKKVLEPKKAYYYINREVAVDVLGGDFLNEYGEIYYSGYVGVGNVPEKINIPKQEKDVAEKIIGELEVDNFSFAGLSILKLLQENGKLESCQYEITRLVLDSKVTPEDIGKKVLAIDNDKFENVLSEKDIKRLIEIHKEIKTKFIEKMVDIFKNPDKHQFKNKNGESIHIKQVFRL